MRITFNTNHYVFTGYFIVLRELTVTGNDIASTIKNVLHDQAYSVD